MSAKSLAQLAVDRDMNPPGQSVVKDSTDVLVAAVPSEALAAYTAVIGVVLAASIGSAYGPFRWSAYGAFVALAMLAPIVLFKRRATASGKDSRKMPIPECLTAGVAAAAWGLVMPGSPLTIIFKGNSLVFATTAVLVGAAAVIGLATQWLGTANRKNPMPKEAGEAAAEEPPPPATEEPPPPAAEEPPPPAAEEAPVPVAPSGAPGIPFSRLVEAIAVTRDPQAPMSG